MICKLYSKKISANKETIIKSHTQGVSTLKSLISSLGESTKQFQIQYKISEFITVEVGKFLLDHLKSSKGKPILNLKPETNTVFHSKSKKNDLDYIYNQLDKMKKKLLVKKTSKL